MEKKWLKATGQSKKHAEELIQVCRYTHELVGELDQFNQLMEQLVTLSSEVVQPD